MFYIYEDIICLLPPFFLLKCLCLHLLNAQTQERNIFFVSINLLNKIHSTHTHIMSHDNKPFEVCFKNNRTVGSLGVWIGDNPLDFVLPVTLCQIILYFMFSRVLYCLLRPLQTPRFICSVLVSFYYPLI